ncbi:efflux RND transporter periplasmic adaptor subunit [Catenovulum agarivorans]|uniref:efflux RND transporter periplasmic adaptor subunit n=1 Tax=Catenovulum agarivorans TaxID=1172192 RepID=UPI00058C86E3|nr:efflux RND transporter periplasmic adaptor subunit [Catenovulum agarivorans]
MEQILNKRVLFPIVILLIGAAAMMGFASMKKPPEEKPATNKTPFVDVQLNQVKQHQVYVRSQGEVEAKYHTVLVAQVDGVVTELADAFVKGGFVKQGQLLAQIDPSDYQAALTEAEANLASAEAQLEQEKAQAQVAKAEWQQISDLEPSELALRKPQLAQAVARVKAAKAHIQRAKRDLERTRIVAPYDAIVSARHVSPGSYANKGGQIGEIYAVSVAEVRLPVAEAQLAFLPQAGVGAKVKLETEIEGKKKVFDARIVGSEGIKNKLNRMHYLVAQIEDPYALQTAGKKHGRIEFGTYVVAKIAGELLDRASVVEYHLIKDGQIAVVDGNNQLEFRHVDVYRVEDGLAVIQQGLAQDDKVIVSALAYPVSGMKLTTNLDDTPSNLSEEADEQTVLAKQADK